MPKWPEIFLNNILKSQQEQEQQQKWKSGKFQSFIIY